jgi:hypothetical protein
MRFEGIWSLMVLLPEPLGPANTRNLGTDTETTNFDDFSDSHLTARLSFTHYTDAAVSLRLNQVGSLNHEHRVPSCKGADKSCMGSARCHVRDLNFQVLDSFFRERFFSDPAMIAPVLGMG